MTTNLTAIISTFLVTNVTIKVEQLSRPIPCPDGMPGCLVYHAEYYDSPTPKYRYVTTTISECRRTVIPLLSLTNDTFKTISNIVDRQIPVTQWISEPNPAMQFVDVTSSNIISTNSISWNIAITNIYYERPTYPPQK